MKIFKKIRTLKVLKLIIPKRFYLIFVIIIISTYFTISFYQDNSKLQFNADQYFWLLSSLIQGFASLLGLIIVVIIFRFQYIFNQKNELSRAIKDGLRHMRNKFGTLQLSEFGFLTEEGLLKYSRKILQVKFFCLFLLFQCLFYNQKQVLQILFNLLMETK